MENGPIQGGIYTFSHLDEEYYIFIEDWTYWTFFKIETTSNNNTDIIRYVENMLETSSDDLLRSKMVTMTTKKFQNNCDGFIGKIPDEIFYDLMGRVIW